MTQFTLDGKELTPKDRLMMLRMEYYTELLAEMTILRNKRIELIKSYKNEVYEIDKQLQKLKSKDKNI